MSGDRVVKRDRLRQCIGLMALVIVAMLAAWDKLPRVELAIDREPPAIDAASFEPVIVQAAPVAIEMEQQPAAVPTSIEIIGPRDVVVGDAVYLRCATTGPVLGITWSVKRSGEDTSALDGLVPADDGQAAWFTNRDLGDYEVICSVADQHGRAAHDAHHFAILGQAKPLSAAGIVERPEEIDLATEIRVWLAEVPPSPASRDHDADRRAEAIVLAGSLRGTAAAIRAGQVAADAEPLVEFARGAEIALGPQAFARWDATFVARLRGLAEYEAAQGHLDGAEAWANLLENVAALMEAWSGE